MSMSDKPECVVPGCTNVRHNRGLCCKHGKALSKTPDSRDGRDAAEHILPAKRRLRNADRGAPAGGARTPKPARRAAGGSPVDLDVVRALNVTQLPTPEGIAFLRPGWEDVVVLTPGGSLRHAKLVMPRLSPADRRTPASGGRASILELTDALDIQRVTIGEVTVLVPLDNGSLIGVAPSGRSFPVEVKLADAAAKRPRVAGEK